MFRRTDCHFRIDADEFDVTADRYRPEMTRLPPLALSEIAS
jgi:hypothetical protein